MSTQPEALRLADALHECKYVDVYRCQQAAAELRRQFGEIESMRAERVHTERRLAKAEAQRDALLEALKKMRIKYGEYACSVCDQADAAIKAAEEGK